MNMKRVETRKMMSWCGMQLNLYSVARKSSAAFPIGYPYSHIAMPRLYREYGGTEYGYQNHYGGTNM